MPLATTVASSSPRDTHILRTNESRESHSLMTATLNQKSQISDAFMMSGVGKTQSQLHHLKHQGGLSDSQENSTSHNTQ